MAEERKGWRGLDSRRHIGVVWDVGTFWPRAYHPLAPPSYTERAVPELQRRLWYIRDHRGAAVIAATTAVFDDTCGNLIQIAHRN